MADLEALKRAAEAATPGPWVVWSSLYEHMDAQLRSADGTVEGVALAEFYRLANGFKNAEFARLANPATILDLISRLEEAEKALAWAQGLIEQLPPNHEGRNSWIMNHGVGPTTEELRDWWARNRSTVPAPKWPDTRSLAHKRLKGGTDEG